MGLTVDHIEIRYRPSDSAAAWTFVTVPAGQGSIQLKGVERGRSYQIEARSVAPSGAASAWVAQTHVVADATILPLAPTGLSATPVADGVALKWAVASTQRPDAEYEVWRTTDLAGAPDPAGWTQIQVVTALAWTDPITDGVLRWYRVRSHDFSGHTSAYSSNINSRGKTVADGADVSKNNVPLTLFNPKFEGGNVGWTSSSLFTIEQNGNAFEGAWCAVFRGNGTVNSDALRNTVLNPVVPGQMVMVRGMIKGAAGDGFARARISWRDASNVEFAVSTAPVQLSGTFGWTLSKVISAAPTGAAIAVMEWEVINCSSGTYYLDAGYLDYLSSDLSEVPDAAASLRYAVRDIDTNRRAVVDFTQGHLSKNLDNIADTTTFVRPFTRSAEPMVGNPTFEQGGGSPTGSDSGWRADIGNSADMTYETSSPILGSRSLKLHGTVGNYTQMSNIIHFTAKPGDAIYVEAAGKVSAAGVKGRIGIQFSLPSGGGSGQGSTTFTGTTAVTQSAQAIAGAGTVEGFLFVMYDATSTAAGDALFDSILVSRVRNIDNELADGTTYFRAGTQAQDNIIHVGTCPSGGGNQFSYRQFSTQSYTIASGDKLHFDVFIDHRSPEFKYSIDFSYGASSFFRGAGTKDQNGLDGHPATDLSAWATGRWYHRVFDLSALAGNAISSWASALEGDTAGLYTGRLANIKIVNGSTLKAVIFSAGALSSTPIFFSAETYTGVSLTTAHLSAGAASLDYHVADGSTYGRALLARLSAGKPLIDFSETIHIAKHLGNVPDDSGSSRYCVLAIDGNRRGIIDLSQGHLNKNLDNLSDTSTRYAAIEARAEANRVGSGNLVYNGGFDTGDSRNWRNADKEHSTGIDDPDAIVLDTAGLESGYVARYAGNARQVLTSRLIPVNPNKRYYIELRLKGSNTAATFYAGFACFDANKSAIPLSPPGASFSYYLAAAANLPSTYQVYSAVTTPGENAADGSLGFGVMRAGTKFITPLLLLNFNNTVGALEFVDYFKIVEIDSTVRNHPRVSNLDDAGTLDFAPTHRNKHLGNMPDNSGSSRFAVLAIDGSRRAITDWSQSHLNKNADNFADGSTYGRPLLARLNSGKPLIDFSEAIHIAKHLGNIPDDSGSARFAVLVIDGNRRAITDFSQGHLNKNLDNVADTSGRWASPQAGASGDGFQILSNPDFAGGSLTGYSVYDNGGTGRITLTAETDTAAPNSSGYRMKIAVTAAGGTIVPGSGGFFRSIGVDSGAFQIDKYHRGSTIIWRIRAKIPSGYNIGWASNAIGDSPTQVWITSQAGTGDWYEYVFKLVTGSTGTFSTTGFFYIDNGSNTAAVTWYVAMCSAVCTSLPAGYGISDIDGNRRALIDFAISHYNKHIDNLADGSTYGRPLLARLNAGKPWIDFSEAIHSGKHLGNMPDDGTNRCAWGTSAQKNAAVDSSGNLLLKNLQEGTASTNSPTTTSNVPSTLAEMTKTITTKGNKVLILFSGVFQHTDATQAATFDIYRDGSSLSATSLIDIPVANENFPITIAKLDSPSAASHTYDIRWATTGATLTGRALNRLLQVVELG